MAGAAEIDEGAALQALLETGAGRLPLPGSGATLERWRALADVAARDLSLVKLFEGHTDALAIMAELGQMTAVPSGSSWGMWAAEAPTARVIARPDADGRWRLEGRKAWCSGARLLSHALLTVWTPDGSGPWLARVALRQPGITINADAWQAVGMSGSESADVHFNHAGAEPVGGAGDYLNRPGFWHGGAGIAACWYGGARGVAAALQETVARAGRVPAGASGDDAGGVLRRAALGRVDLALAHTATLLRSTAAWIDDHPGGDARPLALRARMSAESTARSVLDEVGRALGPAPICRDADMARRFADLPIFIRQSGADRDAAALGDWRASVQGEDAWQL